LASRGCGSSNREREKKHVGKMRLSDDEVMAAQAEGRCTSCKRSLTTRLRSGVFEECSRVPSTGLALSAACCLRHEKQRSLDSRGGEVVASRTGRDFVALRRMQRSSSERFSRGLTLLPLTQRLRALRNMPEHRLTGSMCCLQWFDIS